MGRRANTRLRFWEHVRETPNGCWEWTGSRHRTNGYGKFKIHNRTVAAHRQAFKYARGPIPAGLFVCHQCDNPACVHPGHLFLGTAKQNILNARRKGRMRSRHAWTHCKYGHEYAGRNTRWYVRPSGKSVVRVCRSCERARCAKA